MSLFDDVSWTRSSFCSVGDCIDVGWRKSSFSADSQNCLEVKSEHQVVYVRDSKDKRDDGQHFGPVQVWELDEWRQLLRCVKDNWNPTGVYFADHGVVVGLERHEHMLVFNEDEWDAFVDGVNNEEFEPAVLSSKYRAATGADGSDGQGFPVATPSGAAPVAAQSLDDALDLTLYSPAGRLDENPVLGDSSILSNPTAGQPGHEPAVAAVGGPVGLHRSEAGTGTSPGPVPAADSDGRLWTGEAADAATLELCAAWPVEIGSDLVFAEQIGRIAAKVIWPLAYQAGWSDHEEWAKAAAPLVPTDGAS